MDFPITPVVERVISQAMITYKLREGFTRSFHQPFTFMTMRDKFDNLLVERAVSAGASLMDGFKVDAVQVTETEALVSGERDKVVGRLLVGADGANSVVAHQLGLLREAEIGAGLESEVYVDSQHLEPWGATVSLDFGTIRGGYMWVFPKEDHLSIGVAGFSRVSPRFRLLLNRYLKQLRLGDYQQRLTKGHRLPRRRKGMPIQKGRALLVGDAAGLIDFWTGEGIYYVIKSAQTAATPIQEFLEGNAADLQPYELTIDRDLMPELHIARTLCRVGVWFPRLAYSLLKNSEWAWTAGCMLLRDERSYHDVRGRMGRLSFLFDLVGLGV